MSEWGDTDPTDRQIDYAASLVRQLREDGDDEAEVYAKKVEDCLDRSEMSRLIGKMKELVDELEEGAV